MLNTSTPIVTPAPFPWEHLDIPGRMAIVIRRVREIMGEGRTSREDFHRAPETCDLSDELLDAHIGAACRRVIAAPPEPTYDRETRLAQGLAAMAALLPSAGDLRDRLALFNFPRDEIERLWPELSRRLAQQLDTALSPPATDDLPAWGRAILETNAN